MAADYREPQRQPLRVAETPEFKAAVAEAVKQQQTDILQAVLPALLEKFGGTAAPAAAADTDFAKVMANEMALRIAQISGQGTGKIYIDPVVVEERKTAMRKLGELLVELRAKRQIPVYRLIQKTQLPMGRLGPVVVEPLYRNDRNQQASTEIGWDRVPNLAMEPIGEPAESVFALFRAAIGAELPDTETVIDEFGNTKSVGQGATALSPSGVVLRGGAASAILRNGSRAGQVGDADIGEGVVIRSDNNPLKRQVNVLGTVFGPIEVQ